MLKWTEQCGGLKNVAGAIAMIALALVLLAPSVAAAQTDDEITQAQELYAQGVEAFHSEDFALAISFFNRAYAFDPHPMFLYNVSVAHSRLGNTQEAHRTAGLVLAARGLPADTQVRNDARYFSTGVVLEAESLAAALSQVALKAPDDGVEEGPGFFARIPLGVIGWSGVGASALGLTLMVVAGIISSSLDDDLDSYESARLDRNAERMNRFKTSIEDTQSTGKTVLYVGTGLAIVGAGLLSYDLFFHDRSSSEGQPGSSLSLTGAVSPQSALLGLDWRF
ncbi:MAG: hypothetical protein H0U74_21340 [Bradymonadaceae bacterium]|nr:hypothetical protein [Lujinxingiaceae bacterium]